MTPIQKLQAYLERTHRKRLKLYAELGILPSQEPKWIQQGLSLERRDTIEYEDYE